VPQVARTVTRMSATTSSLEKILRAPAVMRLAEIFRAADHDLYLVGGSVRDALLGRQQEDFDFATSATPEEIESLLSSAASALWTVGREFGTIAAELAGHKVEVTTYRSDVYSSDSRKPTVVFGDSIVEDLRRRDFTMNAMAISLPEGNLVDPFGGVKALAAACLDTPRSPEESFTEDPLRMLRACRFVSQLGAFPSDRVVQAMTRMQRRLEIVSIERVRDELCKILVLDDPVKALWLLVDTKLSDQFLPELASMRLEQDPIHRHKDVLTHTIAVTGKTSPRLRLRLAALLHDIAKPQTRSYGPNGVHFYHHDIVGAKMVRHRLRVLKCPKGLISDVTELVALHLRFHSYGNGWTDSAVRRYVRDAGHLLVDLNELTRCDCTTRNKRRALLLQHRMDELEERIVALREQEELDALRPALNGNEVMTRLGVAPGPEVGEAMRFLLTLRLEEGEISREEASQRLDAWWAERSSSP